jgi:hypothetical protein
MVLAFMAKFPSGQATNFERKILDGVKLFTLRKPSKREYKPGMKLQMAYGVRTKNYRQFAEATVERIERVSMLIMRGIPIFSVLVDGSPVMDMDKFAKDDGFDSLAEFEAYWRGVFDAENVRHMELNQIVWTDIRPV